ncbi:hypothetical protein GCM10017709_12080 [Glutamicibacter nicotianae]|uniref:Uncharacterized protein n=1 Tax=Glutamicibacter nicotianae TaxID=37929 RepID=A0ABQ0RMA8_GLUNI|nr:hypothetical protein ANI01nite_21170 [Glutamicibacter nicotianae]
MERTGTPGKAAIMGPDAEIPRIPTRASKMVTNPDYSFRTQGLHSYAEAGETGDSVEESKYAQFGI